MFSVNGNNSVRLITERLIVRTPLRRDVDFLYEVGREEYFRPCYYPFQSREDAECYIQQRYYRPQFSHMSPWVRARDATMLMISHRVSKKTLGWIGLDSYCPPELEYNDPYFGRVELSYTLHPQAQGEGYMTEALQAVIDYMVEQGLAVRFTADTFATNERSVSLLKRLGFVQCGQHWCSEAGSDFLDFECEREAPAWVHEKANIERARRRQSIQAALIERENHS